MRDNLTREPKRLEQTFRGHEAESRSTRDILTGDRPSTRAAETQKFIDSNRLDSLPSLYYYYLRTAGSGGLLRLHLTSSLTARAIEPSVQC